MDLYRLLSEYPLAMLRAIATHWQLELTAQEPFLAAQQLGDAMLAAGALEARLATLSPEAREALGVLVQHQGQAAMKGLAVRYGELRRIGPGRLERDRPWDDLASPLEELLYHGLAFRGFGAVPGGHGELLRLPDELLARLPLTTQAGPGLNLISAPAPAIIADAGLALSEDLLAVLSFLRRTPPVIAPDDSHRQPPDWLLADTPLGKRLVGSRDAQRLALCWRLLWRLNLVEEKQGHWRPSLVARDWLRAPDSRRATRLLRAWRDDPHMRELEQVLTLACDPDGCPHDPATPRRHLAQFLRALTSGLWHEPADLVQALKRHDPTFLRPDGDLNSWFIRDAATGQYLRGVESWDQVEAALALQLLTKQLHWLGIVRLGYAAPDSPPIALGLTTLGAAMLETDAPQPVKEDAPFASIAVDGVIRVTLRNSAYERYQLERIADWQEQTAKTATYRLTELSVWEGYNAGITVTQMMAFLKRISAAGGNPSNGSAMPPELESTLTSWARRFGRATLRRATLLVLADADTTQEILGDQQLAALIAEALAPNILVVRSRDVDSLNALLRARGIWPQRQDEAP